MNRIEFQNLKVGDICVIKEGHDQGKKCAVIYIEDYIDGCESIIVKAIDCEFTVDTHTTPWHKITDFRALNILN